MPWWGWLIVGVCWLLATLIMLAMCSAAGNYDEWMERWYKQHQRDDWKDNNGKTKSHTDPPEGR